MNKKQLQKIKKIIDFDASIPEHQRLIKRLKKEYMKLPAGEKVNLIEDLKKAFGKK